MSSEIIQILKQVNAIITDDHFVYTSGKHGSVYINKDALYPHTAETSRVGEMFARLYQDLEIDAVVGPALGGIILSTWTARHISLIKKKDVLGLYTEKDNDGNQIFTRGYDKLIRRRKVLVVEDITNTGGSLKKSIDSCRREGAEVAAAAVMINRDPATVNGELFKTEFTSLGVIEAEAYREQDCPLCRQRIPVNAEIGHGRKFLDSKH